MVNTVYTIGYSGFSIDDFVATLKKHNVSLVVDVRSSPFSNYFPEYNKDALEICLKTHGIYYRNYADAFGARQNDRKYYCKEGYLDFEVFSKAEPFLQGLKKLCNSMEQNYTFALLCAEKEGYGAAMGRKIVTKETQEGCLSFLIIRSWNFFKVS